MVNAEEEEAVVLVDRPDTTTEGTKWRWSGQDESDDKQRRWLPKRDQDKNLEARSSGELQVHLNNRDDCEGSKIEILSRIAQTTAVLSRLKIIWRDKNISLASKVKLMGTHILSTFHYASESWTLTAKLERRIQALRLDAIGDL